MNPRWPIYIPTKGRSESLYTMKTFDAIGVPYTIFVEAQEADAYAKRIPGDRIHVLPHRDLGLTVTRNYIWDYAEARGHEWFWTFDDNIRGLYRFNHNLRVPCADGTVMAVIEDFAQRYSNTAICGMNYRFFVKNRHVVPPYILNTRIYSNMLIRTMAADVDGKPFRNVTFFNDDTDLCLRVLKAGWATVQFNAFLIGKETTMVTPGGMTDYYKQTDRRREFAEELAAAHPDVVRVTEKWNRVHHQVDYSVFQHRLQFRAGVQIPRGVNNFGMVFQERGRDGLWRNAEPKAGEESAA